MIIGIGNDIIDITRIERVLDRFGERFLDRIFTADERARAERRANRAATYAKRFAAKEACSKALGTGFRRGVFWRDMGVSNLRSGKPTMQLTGGALGRLNKIVPDGMVAQIDVSLSDDFPMAQAVVLISASPRSEVSHDG
jgi:holo-[acyl-carrier protein] synthase